MRIQIENRQKNQKVEKRKLRKVAQKILNALGCPEGEVSLLIVDDEQIQILNRDFLGKDRPTNVISFAMQEGQGSGISPQLLGDVVISADTAARDAGEAGLTFESELHFLLVHGMLHLAGYDHERGTQDEARIMEMREEEIYEQIRREFPT